MAEVRKSGDLVSVYDLITNVVGETNPGRRWKRLTAASDNAALLEASTMHVFKPRGGQTPGIQSSSVAALLKVLKYPNAEAMARSVLEGRQATPSTSTPAAVPAPADSTVLELLGRMVDGILGVRDEVAGVRASLENNNASRNGIVDNLERRNFPEVDGSMSDLVSVYDIVRGMFGWSRERTVREVSAILEGSCKVHTIPLRGMLCAEEKDAMKVIRLLKMKEDKDKPGTACSKNDTLDYSEDEFDIGKTREPPLHNLGCTCIQCS
jgi:hypothetical protein